MNHQTIDMKLRLIIILFILTGFVQTANSQEERSNKKVALVLSGGGAKGVAHIGVLKVLEKAGLPIEIITGTSMGSIVGGLYSCGNSAMRLDSIVRAQDWTEVFSDKDDLRYQSLKERESHNTYVFSTSLRLKKRKNLIGGGIIFGKNIGKLLNTFTTPYNDSIDFNTLPIPFACVATNVVDNSEIVIHNGVLSEAMRASMSIPGAFSPVRKGDKVLVDGGLRNNYPADVAKEMGADYIVGVSVASKLKTAEKLRSASDIILQIVDFNCKNKMDENLAITDIPIIVNTEGYSTASFSPAAIDTLIRRGEEAAMAHWDEIIALKEKLNPVQTRPRTHAVQVELSDNPSYKMGMIRFENMSSRDESFLRNKFKMHEGDSIDNERAHLITTSIRLDLFYENADFHVDRGVIDMPDGTKADRITFIAGEKRPNIMKVGIRFDTEEIVAMQTNLAFPIRNKLPMEFDFTLRLGKRIKAEANLDFHPTSLITPNIKLAFHRNNYYIYRKGSRCYDLTYNRLSAVAAPLTFDVRNFHFSIGAAIDYYFNYKLLYNLDTDYFIILPDHDHFISYFANTDYNSENDWYFPTKGSKFKARYAYYTDNFLRLDDKVGVHEVSAMWRTNFPIGNKFAIQPMFYGRLVHYESTPVILRNFMGGDWFGHYIDQQLPFAGIGYIELQKDKFIAAQLQAQYSLASNHYILLKCTAAQDSDEYKDLFKDKLMFGTSLSYYYNALSGPVGMSLGYSSVTKEPYFYINLGYVF